MLFTPHILTGAAIGSQIPSFGVVFVLSIISHFCLDLFPHWQYTEGEAFKDKLGKRFVVEALRVAMDTAFVFALLFFFFDSKPDFKYMIFGGLIAVMPDILLFVSWKINLKILKKISHFHEETVHLFGHEKSPNFQGLFWQILFSLIAFSVILFL